MLRYSHYVETDTPHESWTGGVTTEYLVSEYAAGTLPGDPNAPDWRCESRYPKNGPRCLMWKDSKAIVFAKGRGYYRTPSLCAPPRLYRYKHMTGMEISPLEQSRNAVDCLSCKLAKPQRMSYKSVHPSRSIVCCKKLMTDVCYYGEVWDWKWCW
ncbi:uncharacterized protein PITG_20957 [Phytophthora infestans T30-4]|uniref:Uncharacterized protein n=1 Tax=Phytophthora infestans (strain T30-4) TaxID=403677 RepID=D0P2W0_PHYIT|nr:uncharacterized protein PITG_20957 [Phytophthora infestans T30-4]EEY57099.1 hypothetical protein PITG_20957 [Phytophthora infestans T30-4]|eukprot:XP_002895357.1 hypothetical protein PITG_20957 [Phytophthora infestans T30-4]